MFYKFNIFSDIWPTVSKCQRNSGPPTDFWVLWLPYAGNLIKLPTILCVLLLAKSGHLKCKSYENSLQLWTDLTVVCATVARGSVSCNKWEYQSASSVVGNSSDISLGHRWLLAGEASSHVLRGKETCMTLLHAHFPCGILVSVKCTVFSMSIGVYYSVCNALWWFMFRVIWVLCLRSW